MTPDLEAIFSELGLAQYLDTFVDQGFDTWDTILDIQESDLDILGVKLGHRRKLQRRIANERGVSPGLSLTSGKESKDDPKQEGSTIGINRSDTSHETNGVVKRKYRRHPKPDENAPERPPSAYVLFSNKMRDDLKSQNLTFTEIAKLVGENWQTLPATEKETYENQANAAKEKYHRSLLEYKKTPEYRKYMQYLRDFKEKQAKNNQVHDAAKRAKFVEASRPRHGSSSSSTPNGGHASSTSGSGSEHSHRVRDFDVSSHSQASSQHSSLNPTPARQPNSPEDRMRTMGRSHRELSASRDDERRQARKPAIGKDGNDHSGGRYLPPLSDMIDRSKLNVAGGGMEGNPYGSGFVAANRRPGILDGPAAIPRARAPYLRHEPSSNDSTESANSATSFSREGSVPIHALLTGRVNNPSTGAESPPFPHLTSPVAVSAAALPGPYRPGYGFQSTSSAFHHMRAERSGDGDVVMTSADTATAPDGRGRARFDGMNALLEAGEIVGRR